MPDDNCDAACQKIIIDGGALAGEASALWEAAPRGSKIAQEAIALSRQIDSQGLIAAPIECHADKRTKDALAAMSQDQCDFADTLRAWRDAGMPETDAMNTNRLRTKRLQYHYFLRDIALGEAVTWPPTPEA